MLRRGDRARPRAATSRRGCCATLSANAERLGLAGRDRRPPTPSGCRSRTRASTSCSATPCCTTSPTCRARSREFERVLAPGGTRAVRRRALSLRRPAGARSQARRKRDRARLAAGDPSAPAARHESDADPDEALERVVDVHAFAPGELAAGGTRRQGSKTCASPARSCSRTGSAGRTARWRRAPTRKDVPWAWRQYAYRGYLVLQELDRRLLEARLPPAIFYNLMLTAHKPPVA